MSGPQCKECGNPITGKGKTGMCRKCAFAAARDSRSAPERHKQILAAPSVQESLAPAQIREKTIFEQVDTPVRIHDRPLGDGPKNDPTVVYNKDPNEEYRWVDENPDHVKRAAARGFRPVKAAGSNLDAPFLDQGRMDGYIGRPGLGLMSVDRAQAEKRRAANKPPEPKALAEAEMEASIEGSARAGIITKEQADKFRGQFQEHEEKIHIPKEE